MVTFLGIFFILLVINGALLMFSSNGSKEKVGPAVKDGLEASDAKIYPIELLGSNKYKKAI